MESRLSLEGKDKINTPPVRNEAKSDTSLARHGTEHKASKTGLNLWMGIGEGGGTRRLGYRNTVAL